MGNSKVERVLDWIGEYMQMWIDKPYVMLGTALAPLAVVGLFKLLSKL